MISKTILSAAIISAFVASMTFLPAMAASPLPYLTITKSIVTNSPASVTIVTAAPVRSGIPNAYGYGVVVRGGMLVVTTHAGVGPDSVAQKSASDPIFHTHFVTFKPAADCLSHQAVDTASLNQVGDLKISGNTISVTNIDPSVGTLTNRVVAFTLSVVGSDICVNPP